MRLPNFIGGSCPAQSPTAALERTINLYPEPSETPGEKGRGKLYPTPGMTTFATASVDTPVRGMFYTHDGRLFAVIGATLYECDSAGTLTSRGTVALTSTEPAYLTSNGDGGGQMFISSGNVGYAYDLGTDTLTTEIASGSAMCAMLDGFILSLDAATSTWSISDLNDATTWDPLQAQQRSQAPDRWVSLAVAGSDVWLLGEETSEVWYNAGAAPFPFQPHPNGVVPYGCAAPHSARVAGDSVLWLAKSKHGSGEVVMSSGLSVRVISTAALAWQFSQYADISDAVADVYQDQGHTFYVLTFPTADATWVYDLSTGLWHERGTWDEGAVEFSAWRPLYHAFAFGAHLFGDRLAGTIYTGSVTTYTDVDGLSIRRVRVPPVLASENARLFFTTFDLDLETGLGLESGQGSDPEVMLEYSDDNGKTWTSASTRTAGAQGAYSTQVRWHRLGSSRARVFRISMTDPVPYRLIDAYVQLRPGADA